MEISTIHAVIDKKLGSSALSCYIIGFRKVNKQLVNNHLEIQKKFGREYVFVPVNSEKYEIGDIIDIPFKDVDKNVPENKLPIISYHGIIKQSTAILLIEINEPYLENHFLNLASIAKDIPRELYEFVKNKGKDFYLSFGDKLIGPFRHNQNGFIPLKGRSTTLYSSNGVDILDYPDLTDRKFKDLLIILDTHLPKINDLDCSTESQLIDWLKGKFRTLNDDRKIAELLNQFNTTFSYDSLEEIEFSKFKRIQNILDRLEFGISELESLINDPIFKTTIDTSIKKNISHFIENNLDSFQSKIAEKKEALKKDFDEEFKKNEIRKKEIILKTKELEETFQLKLGEYNSSIDSIQTELDEIAKNKLELNNEITTLENKRLELIEEIKIASQMGSTPQPNGYNKITTFYEKRTYISYRNIFFDTIDEYENELELLKIRGKSFLIESIEQLRTKKFFLADNIASTLTLLCTTGNIHVYIQQAEGDWLKFEKWFNNGLSNMLSEAHHNPDQNFCFLLQDCNIASPECYAKPIIDISRGIRKNIPGLPQLWPENVWIILIPLEVEIEDFGFDILHESTFSTWGRLGNYKPNNSQELMMGKKWKLR